MNTSPRFSGVLFDMDGTLLDSEHLHVAANRRLFEECRLDVPLSEHEGFRGRPAVAVFAEMRERYGGGTMTTAEMVARKQALFRELAGDARLLTGARELLDALRQRGIPHALVTSTDRVLVEEIITRLGLHFDAVVTVEDVTHPKPDPEPFRLGAERLGLAPSACVAVEDALSGVRSARAAGCYVIAVPTSFDADALREAGAHLVMPDLEAVRMMLLGA